MLSFDTALTNTLAAATSKQNFADLLIAALGPNRTLRCFRDANPAATNPYLTGTEFLTAAMSGALTSAAGNITGFGTVDSVALQLPADLATGKSILRIEGNGHVVQGTLGPIGGNTDFFLPSNVTASTGIGFSPAASIRAWHLLPSGTGPAAPDLTANSPATLELWNWQDPNAPVLVGTLAFDNRIDDLVFQDAEIAAEMGDVRVTQSTQSIVYGEYEFGAMYLSAHAGINGEASVPLDQVLVGCKPYGRWSDYPFELTYDPAIDGTFPKPFKAILKRADGGVLHTFEMHDGLAINDPSLGQAIDPAFLKPIRPGFNCGQLLPWQSHLPKVATKAKKFFPGITAQGRRPSIGKQASIINGTFPLAWGRVQGNSMSHWWAAPKWSLPSDPTFPAPLVADNESWDPYLFRGDTDYHRYEGRIWRIQGWDYEPGASGNHDWLNGPGGPRIDRACIATPLSMYADEPDGVRLKGNVPYKTLANAWGLNYFNIPLHYLTNAKTFATQPDANYYQGLSSYGQAYYGYRMDYAAPGRNVALHGIANGADWPPPDKDGRHHFNGWAVDDQHNYANPGWMTLLFNSPMHAYGQKLRTHAASMAQLGAIGMGGASGPGAFLHRQFAWRILVQVMAWKLAADHPLGLERKAIEARLQAEIEAIYPNIYKPAMVDNNPDVFFQGIRRFGIGARYGSNDSGTWIEKEDDFKCFYFSHVLMLMKQTGCWAAMRARSTLCAQMLDFIVACLDKHSIDNIYYTYGRADNLLADFAPNGSSPVMPADWQDWATVFPRNGVEDALYGPDGNYRKGGDGSNLINFVGEPATSNLRMQYALMRRDFFPEIPHPRLATVCTRIQAWYDQVEARVNAAATPVDKSDQDFAYWIAPHGIFNAPTELGPA